MAGWFAAVSLLSAWGRRRIVARDRRAEEALCYRAVSALPPEAIRRFATALGLMPLPPAETLPGPFLLEQWLRRHGPLWTDALPLDGQGTVAGEGHVVVIGGVDTAPAAPRLYVLDPSPAERGHEGWRPYGQFQAALALHARAREPVSFMTHP